MSTDNQVSGSDENNKATQTDFTRHKLSSKIETIILKNELKAMTSQDCAKIVNKLSYEVVSKHSIKMKHFVGLTTSQYEVLYDLWNDLFPACLRPLQFNQRFNCSTVYFAGSASNLQPGTPSFSVKIVAFALEESFNSVKSDFKSSAIPVCLSESRF